MIDLDKLCFDKVDQTLIEHLVVVVVQVKVRDVGQIRHEAGDKLWDRICLIHQQVDILRLAHGESDAEQEITVGRSHP